MTKTLTILFSLLFFFTACEKDELIIDNISSDPDLLYDLQRVKELVVVDSAYLFSLETYLYRDFMPPTTVDGRPMIAVNQLTEYFGSSIPTKIVLVKQYVVNGNEVWITDYDERNPGFDRSVLEGISRNGPKWDPGIRVDVICEFEDVVRDTVYRIIARRQVIESVF